MPTIATRAGKVHYEEHGRGRPVVLLHALLHDHHDYDPVVLALAEHYRTIAVDWPNHGDSDRVAAGRPFGAALLADVLEDVVAGLALEPALFVGNSVGGFAAGRLAVEDPAAVAGLVLVNTGGFTKWSPISRAACRMLGRPGMIRRVTPWTIPLYMRAQSAADAAIVDGARGRARTAAGARTAAALWRSFAEPSFDLRPRAAAISAPTLLVWGTRDVVTPLRRGRQTQEVLPHAELVTFDTGHVVFSSQPEAFLGYVLPFAAGVFSGDRS